MWDLCSFFFIAPTEYDEKTRKKRWKEDSAAQLAELIEVLRAREPFDIEGTEEEVKAWIESKGYHLGNIMNATRLALVGEGKGPHIFDITEALGKEESIRRIQRAIDKLSIDNTHTFLCLYCRYDFSFPPEGTPDAFRPVEDE